jgi:hypothetical protein
MLKPHTLNCAEAARFIGNKVPQAMKVERAQMGEWHLQERT